MELERCSHEESVSNSLGFVCWWKIIVIITITITITITIKSGASFSRLANARTVRYFRRVETRDEKIFCFTQKLAFFKLYQKSETRNRWARGAVCRVICCS